MIFDIKDLAGKKHAEFILFYPKDSSLGYHGLSFRDQYETLKT
jgi:hypothetical protein